MEESYLHIITLPCCAHVISLVAEDVAHQTKTDENGKKEKAVIDTVTSCCKVAAYFLNCSFWFKSRR